MSLPLILGLAGLGFKVYGQNQKRSADAAQLEAAAKNLYTEAAQTARQGEYVAWVRALDLEQRLGDLKANLGASGADSSVGAAAVAQRMTATFGGMDVAMERLNAARKARGIRAHAKQYEEQADDLRSQGPMEDVATILGGASSLGGLV